MAIFFQVWNSITVIDEVAPAVGAEEIVPELGDNHAGLDIGLGEVTADKFQDFWDFDRVGFQTDGHCLIGGGDCVSVCGGTEGKKK